MLCVDAHGCGSSGEGAVNPLVLVSPEPRRSDRDDDALVAAVRAGDERAFEELYARYHRRIAAFVRGMVRDHGRAEDVTQEVFLSALRRMGQTDRPIAFRPWVYEIARNACIDHFRRSSRTNEVPFHGEDSGGPDDPAHLAAPTAGPDAAVAHKQELDLLRGAFGGLSASHHEILVLRELEGLSYREIGDRMGLTRPAVESTLFRARRRLFQEYAELDSGRRCRRMQALLAETQDGLELGVREVRRLSRHLAWCGPCRRHAYHAGLAAELGVLRIRDRVAAWAPWPLLLALRAARPGADASRAGGSPGSLPLGVAHAAPGLSEMLAGPAARLATVGALAVSSVGAGLSAQPSHHPAGSRSIKALLPPPGTAAIAGRAGGLAVPGPPGGAIASAPAKRGPQSAVSPARQRGGAGADVGRPGSAAPGGAAGHRATQSAAHRPATDRPGGPASSAPSGLPPAALPPVAVPALPAVPAPVGSGGSSTPAVHPSAPGPSPAPSSSVPGATGPSIALPPSLGNGTGDPTGGAAGAIAPRAGGLLSR